MYYCFLQFSILKFFRYFGSSRCVSVLTTLHFLSGENQRKFENIYGQNRLDHSLTKVDHDYWFERKESTDGIRPEQYV